MAYHSTQQLIVWLQIVMNGDKVVLGLSGKYHELMSIGHPSTRIFVDHAQLNHTTVSDNDENVYSVHIFGIYMYVHT